VGTKLSQRAKDFGLAIRMGTLIYQSPGADCLIVNTFELVIRQRDNVFDAGQLTVIGWRGSISRVA
jgi:hypothetical protein